jgi:protein gp37
VAGVAAAERVARRVRRECPVADRVDELRATPAAVRFLSCEPLLGPLTGRVIEEAQISGDAAYARGPDGSVSYSIPIIATKHRPMLDLTGIAWVIAGGESGGPPERMLVERDRTGRWVPKPHEEEWARGIRDEAARQGVAFLWKQWGGPTPHSGGRELDGRTWDEYPVTEA